VKQKNKEETIAKFKELRPDVVIDLRMPERGEVAEVALGGVSAIEIRRLDPQRKNYCLFCMHSGDVQRARGRFC